jgi:DNA-directed RNA polymerase subunit RPC12/RpoP
MKIEHIKTRCFICWKSYEIGQLIDPNNSEHLYIDYKTREYRYYNWGRNKEIEKVILLILDNNKKLQTENDNTKGNTAIELIGLLADYSFEPILGYVKCPRCSTRFHSLKKNKTRIGMVGELTFNNISTFSENEKIIYLKNKLKTRYNRLE